MKSDTEYIHTERPEIEPIEYIKIDRDNYSPITWVVVTLFAMMIGIGAGIITFAWASYFFS